MKPSLIFYWIYWLLLSSLQAQSSDSSPRSVTLQVWQHFLDHELHWPGAEMNLIAVFPEENQTIRAFSEAGYTASIQVDQDSLISSSLLDAGIVSSVVKGNKEYYLLNHLKEIFIYKPDAFIKRIGQLPHPAGESLAVAWLYGVKGDSLLEVQGTHDWLRYRLTKDTAILVEKYPFQEQMLCVHPLGINQFIQSTAKGKIYLAEADKAKKLKIHQPASGSGIEGVTLDATTQYWAYFDKQRIHVLNNVFQKKAVFKTYLESVREFQFIGNDFLLALGPDDLYEYYQISTKKLLATNRQIESNFKEANKVKSLPQLGSGVLMTLAGNGAILDSVKLKSFPTDVHVQDQCALTLSNAELLVYAVKQNGKLVRTLKKDLSALLYPVRNMQYFQNFEYNAHNGHFAYATWFVYGLKGLDYQKVGFEVLNVYSRCFKVSLNAFDTVAIVLYTSRFVNYRTGFLGYSLYGDDKRSKYNKTYQKKFKTPRGYLPGMDNFLMPYDIATSKQMELIAAYDAAGLLRFFSMAKIDTVFSKVYPKLVRGVYFKPRQTIEVALEDGSLEYLEYQPKKYQFKVLRMEHLPVSIQALGVSHNYADQYLFYNRDTIHLVTKGSMQVTTWVNPYSDLKIKEVQYHEGSQYYTVLLSSRIMKPMEQLFEQMEDAAPHSTPIFSTKGALPGQVLSLNTDGEVTIYQFSTGSSKAKK